LSRAFRTPLAPALLLIALILLSAGAVAQVTPPDPPASADAELAALRTRVAQLEAEVRSLSDAKHEPIAISASATAPANAVSAPADATTSATTGAPAPAAPAPAPETSSAKSNLSPWASVQISGFVDAYGSLNTNTPATGANGLYNFDTAANSFALNLAEIKFVKPVDKPGDVGFTAALGAGNAANMVVAADPSHDTSLKNVLQAFASYKAPIGSGLQIDFGKFVTNMGAEVIETKDNWNYSRSLLFSYAIPYYHFGVRATYAVGSKWSFYGSVVNGWNNVVDNNNGKSFGGGFTYTPSSHLSLAENYMTGPEITGDNHNYRKMTDTVLTTTVTPAVSLMFNYDYGDDRLAGSAVRWQGAAAYLRYTVNPHFAVTPRVEWFTDPQGFMTGTNMATSVRELTVTPEWKINNNLLFRSEFRRDVSSHPLFSLHSGGLTPYQNTVTSGAILMF
jgi:hypothetical protein